MFDIFPLLGVQDSHIHEVSVHVDVLFVVDLRALWTRAKAMTCEAAFVHIDRVVLFVRRRKVKT